MFKTFFHCFKHFSFVFPSFSFFPFPFSLFLFFFPFFLFRFTFFLFPFPFSLFALHFSLFALPSLSLIGFYNLHHICITHVVRAFIGIKRLQKGFFLISLYSLHSALSKFTSAYITMSAECRNKRKYR